MKVLHAPQHMSDGLDANLATILQLKPTLVTLTEQDSGRRDNASRVHAKVGSKYHVCVAKADASHSREVIVLLRKRPLRRVTNVLVTQLSPDIASSGSNPGLGNDRHQIVVRWKGPRRKWAHIATHWNAGIQDRDTGTLLENSRAQAMDAGAGPILEDTLVKLLREGRKVTGSADFNYSNAKLKSRSWRYAPSRIFERHGFGFRAIGLDWLWFSGDLRLSAFEVIPPGRQGNHSDHPWLLATLK